MQLEKLRVVLVQTYFGSLWVCWTLPIAASLNSAG